MKKYHFTKLIFTKYTGCLFTYYTLNTAFSVLVNKKCFYEKKNYYSISFRAEHSLEQKQGLQNLKKLKNYFLQIANGQNLRN